MIQSLLLTAKSRKTDPPSYVLHTLQIYLLILHIHVVVWDKHMYQCKLLYSGVANYHVVVCVTMGIACNRLRPQYIGILADEHEFKFVHGASFTLETIQCFIII